MSNTVLKGLQIFLAIAILGLAYLLYRSIKDPYRIVEERQRLTELTRQRMGHLRTALTRYNEINNGYPSTLDSLVIFVNEDSLMQVAQDSLLPGLTAPVDSLPYSPRTGKTFEYAVNDTSRIKIYFLADPDSDDRIGARNPDITMVNAASWE